MFIGREKELSDLNTLYEQDKFQLLVLYGRRRVGKTALLNEFCRDKPTIFYSAEQSNDKLNLEKFWRPFQVLCKLKNSDIRYVNSYVRAESFLMVLPLSALYMDLRACQ